VASREGETRGVGAVSQSAGPHRQTGSPTHSCVVGALCDLLGSVRDKWLYVTSANICSIRDSKFTEIQFNSHLFSTDDSSHLLLLLLLCSCLLLKVCSSAPGKAGMGGESGVYHDEDEGESGIGGGGREEEERVSHRATAEAVGAAMLVPTPRHRCWGAGHVIVCRCCCRAERVAAPCALCVEMDADMQTRI
jgi:hypothetical protein